MRPVAIAVAVAIDVAGAVLGAGAEVRLDRRVVLTRIKVPVAGYFLNRGFWCRQTGLRRYLERRVVAAAAALPRNSVLRGISAALGAGLRVLRDRGVREREQRGCRHPQREYFLQPHLVALGDPGDRVALQI